MSRINLNGYWTTTEKLEVKYGSVEFESKKYFLTQHAYADNYRDYIRYYANAIDTDGKEYKITWDTTEIWDLSNELYQLEFKQQNLQSYEEMTEEELERIKELQEMTLTNCDDESNACDWDNPAEVEEID